MPVWVLVAVGLASLVATAATAPVAARLVLRGRGNDVLTIGAGSLLVLASAVLGRIGSLESHRLQLLVAVIGAAALVVHGAAESSRFALRVVLEVACAVALVVAGLRLSVTVIEPLNVALTIAWIVAVANLVNVLDRLEGFASLAVLVGALGAAYLGTILEQSRVSLMAAVLAGAGAGLLLHNRPPPLQLLGDGSSLGLGFLLAVVVGKLNLLTGVHAGEAGPRRLGGVLLLIALGIVDTILISRSRRTRRLTPFATARPVLLIVVAHVAVGVVAASLVIFHDAGPATIVGALLALAAFATWVVHVLLRPRATAPSARH